MSEKIDLSAAQKKLAETLKGIGADLWGKASPDDWAEEAFDAGAAENMREHILENARGKNAGNSTGKDSGAAKPEKAAKTEGTAAGKDAEQKTRRTGIDHLWVTADETIDWTEALLYTRPRDGLTGPKLWGFYHRMAEKVLEGDLEAYVEVLTTLNPLGDLTDYVNGMLLRAPGAERLECEFECRPEEIEKDARGYLGALSVRIARDLLAVLPVEEVHVLGRMNGNDQVDVTFRRSQMLKRKMAFLIPADFVEECGGRLEG